MPIPIHRIALLSVASLALLLGSVMLAQAGEPQKAIGRITAIDAAAGTLAVTETGAAAATTIGFDKKTRIAERTKQMKATDLATGQQVSVSYRTEDGASLASRIDVLQPIGASDGK